MSWKSTTRASVDSNQAEIVAALRKAGCYVLLMNGIIDLVVGRCGNTYLLEVKRLKKRGHKDEFTNSQKRFFQEWRGGVVKVVYTVEDALNAVGIDGF